MKKSTVKEVIITVLQKNGKSLNSKEIYDLIVKQRLYDFKSKTPLAIVNAVLRKSCVGIEIKKSEKTKLFQINDNEEFTLI